MTSVVADSADSVGFVVNQDGSTLVGPKPRRAAWSPEAWAQLVPRADAAVIKPARVPEPPPPARMPGDPDGDELEVLYLLSTYTAGLAAMVGEIAPPWTRARPRSWSNYADLLRVGRYLYESDLSPVRWVKFTFEMWKSIGRLGAPPVRWVLNSALLAKHAGWAKSSTEGMGGRVVITPALRELADRESVMNADLMGRPPTSEADLVDRVAEHFPDGLHATLCGRAGREAAQQRARMASWLERGEWPWL